MTGAGSLVHIPSGDVRMEGVLEAPPNAPGMVLFAHGSGSSRLSPRNNFVAAELRKAGLGTLLLDLLTRDEDRDYETRFAITLLAERLADAVRWLRQEPAVGLLPVGLFGASTGAAAALQVAASQPHEIGAVVSRGGRPDLAGAQALAKVRAPTLLIVGGADYGVIELNEAAYARLTCEKQLVIVPRATHLFEEPGALEEVARLAAAWFARSLAR
ncbi:MAG: dienelactone hydrolase family protein [Burkholderiales bacterium]|jgi:putative phosphoribosyl transferase|nr:dienelactone hydrolase family protein [Burkholderiales bacterium]